jgi:hypothetical protein
MARALTRRSGARLDGSGAGAVGRLRGRRGAGARGEARMQIRELCLEACLRTLRAGGEKWLKGRAAPHENDHRGRRAASPGRAGRARGRGGGGPCGRRGRRGRQSARHAGAPARSSSASGAGPAAAHKDRPRAPRHPPAPRNAPRAGARGRDARLGGLLGREGCLLELREVALRRARAAVSARRRHQRAGPPRHPGPVEGAQRACSTTIL